MVLTPTYYVFKMYVPFQDATFVPVKFDAGTYTYSNINLPRIDAIAAKDKTGKLWLAITNVDPNEPIDLEASFSGFSAKSATGQVLTGPKVDSINTFDTPKAVLAKPISLHVQAGKVALRLEPKSVTVVSVEQ